MSAAGKNFFGNPGSDPLHHHTHKAGIKAEKVRKNFFFFSSLANPRQASLLSKVTQISLSPRSFQKRRKKGSSLQVEEPKEENWTHGIPQKMLLDFLSLNFQLSPKGLSPLQLFSKYATTAGFHAKKIFRFVFSHLQTCVRTFPVRLLRSQIAFSSPFLFFLLFPGRLRNNIKGNGSGTNSTAPFFSISHLFHTHSACNFSLFFILFHLSHPLTGRGGRGRPLAFLALCSSAAEEEPRSF